MSTYLLNLGFSMGTQASVNGNFEPYAPATGLATSCAWFKYIGVGLNLPTTPSFLGYSLADADWQLVGDDSTQLPLVQGDNLLVRIFPADSTSPAGCLLRVTGVFGHGRDHSHDTHPKMQSPLRMGTQARPVIDSDNSNATNWPPSPTGDNVWTMYLGMIYAQPRAAHYSMSIGATVFNSNTQALVAYGDDPTMHVGGTGPDEACAAA